MSNRRRGKLVEMCHSDNPITRMEGFVELSKNLDRESISAMVESYENQSDFDAATSYITLQLITFAWAQHDPHGAMAWADKRDPFIMQGIASHSILHSWACTDPEAALGWARENCDKKDISYGRGNKLLLGVIQGVAENDLAGATKLMTELKYGSYLDEAALILVPKVWEKGEEAAINWAESLPAGEARDAAYRSIGKKYAVEDLSSATQWVDGMEISKVKTEIAADLADTFAIKNPVGAATWVSNMPEGEARSQSMRAVVSQCLEKDPSAVGEWLNQFPVSESTDESFAIISHHIAKSDPESALTWASVIVDPERRKKAVTYVNRFIEQISQDAN